MSFNLDKLRNGIMGLPPEICCFYLQACTVCLESCDHEPGVKFNTSLANDLSLVWNKNRKNINRGWKDMQESTEYGATAIALLMAELFSGYSYVERAPKGFGFDYWLGDDDNDCDIFNNKARLEISGIFAESKTNKLEQRLKQKGNQIKKSQNSLLKGHVCVVVFNEPKAEYNIEL